MSKKLYNHDIYTIELEIKELENYVELTRAFQRNCVTREFYDLYDLQVEYIQGKIFEKQKQLELFQELYGL